MSSAGGGGPTPQQRFYVAFALKSEHDFYCISADVGRREWALERIEGGTSTCIQAIGDASLRANVFYALLLQVRRGPRPSIAFGQILTFQMGVGHSLIFLHWLLFARPGSWVECVARCERSRRVYERAPGRAQQLHDGHDATDRAGRSAGDARAQLEGCLQGLESILPHWCTHCE